MNFLRVFFLVLALGVLIGGCSQQDDLTQPDNSTTVIRTDKDGTEYLGEITIADGSCFAEGGVGMVDTDSGTLEITVPLGATVEQVLLYWMGGTTAADGDDEIEVDGNPVTGTLIGGATNFFGDYDFRAYRADVTDQDWVVPGDNSFTITGFDFDFSGGTLDENNGAGMIVVYDDGTESELQLFDGLDMAFFKFSPTLDATVPVTFDFLAESADRTGKFVVLAGSVGENRPNMIKATTSAGDQVFDSPLGSMDGMLFDSITLDVNIPAGDTQLTVQLFSTVSEDPLGASLGWIGTGLSVPVTPPELYCLGDLVWFDENRNGCQDSGEMGMEGVTVNLWEGCPPAEVIATTTTDADGMYMFCDLMPGDYTVQFVAPDGYEFCQQYAVGCGMEDDSNPGSDGITDCVTIVDADDLTIDAGLCLPPELGCLGDFVWNDLNMDGIQDEGENGINGIYVDLMDCNGMVLASTMTDINGNYLFCDLEAGDYNVHFVLPDGYIFSPMDQGGDDAVDSDVDAQTGMTVCTTLEPGEHDLTWDAGMYMPVVEDVGCRFTGGGNSTFVTDSEDVEVYTFGGQAGAPLASQPQPWGNWTHHQKNGPSGSFVFHAGTPSAPEGTEIDWISCMDPGWCVQARRAPAKQLDFGGVGTFKNMKGDPEGIAEHVTVGESLHWFEVNIDDLGEPGGHDNPGGCDPLGFGRNGGTELADCDCPDFYRIRIYTGMTDATEIMYEVYGYIDNGNFQIHPPTGRDSKLLDF